MSRDFPALALFVISLFVVPSRAQVSGEETVGGGREITVEIDSARNKNQSRSLGVALLGSALLPGVGETYLREGRSARTFLLAEAGFWAAVFFAWQSRNGYLQSARNYAAEYAGANSAGKGEGYLNALTEFRAYAEKEHRQDSYELSQVLAGDRDGNYPIAPADAWDFGSSNTPENTAHWKQFQSVMRHYRGAKIALSFAAGALVLNRVASLAHTLRIYRRTAGKGLSYRLDPEIAPDYTGLRLSLAF